MSKEILNKDPRPKRRAHDEYRSQLGGESKTRDPQAGHTDGDVRAVRGATPLGDGADGPPQWHPRQSHLAQRNGREKEKHADTAAPHTQNNTKHSGVSSVVLTRSVAILAQAISCSNVHGVFHVHEPSGFVLSKCLQSSFVVSHPYSWHV